MMNQEKIGKFIADCRKANGYTQAALAEKLGITDRAVSKWENGKSMPDASIMLELCELLKINVNELLTGEHIIMEKYREMAEENLLELLLLKIEKCGKNGDYNLYRQVKSSNIIHLGASKQGKIKYIRRNASHDYLNHERRLSSV